MSRRIKVQSVTPEEIGLCGCWQILAVERTVLDLSNPGEDPSVETGYYVTSREEAEMAPDQLLQASIDHWAAIENGTHWVRDVSFGEDACRIRHPTAARNMVSLRNLTIGLYNLEKHRGKTKAPSLPSWSRSMRDAQALRHILRR